MDDDAVTPEAIDAAVRAFVAARRTGRLLARLPEGSRPASLDDAHAVQDATAHALGDAIAGWKVLSPVDGRIARGALLRSRIFQSPAAIDAADVPLLGVEAEIAFRFDRALPPRSTAYSHEEVAAAATALAAIEVVDSRFADYKGSAMLDRVADCGSNGAFVHGAPISDWRSLDLVDIGVTMTVGGTVVADRRGGHASGHPLLPAIALANALRETTGVPRGALMTTGTYTGLNYANPGQDVCVAFAGFEPVSVRFRA
jgi:2-keto-4-pentenoate hydratase